MAADGLICEGDHLVLDVNGEKLSFVQKIKAFGTVRVGKYVVPAAPLIGAPYGSLFEVTDGKRLQRVLLPPPDEITRVTETERDNSNLFDRNTENQKLTHEQIEELKKSGKAGREIIETICSNSATFQNKTEFSQDKYKRRKAKKYLTFVTIRKPTARIVCEAFTEKSAEKILHLRHDSLAVMLSLANVAAGAKVLVVEQCLGVVTAAAVERLGGMGTVCGVQLDERPAPVDAVRQMNLDVAQRAVLFTAPASSLLRDQAAMVRGQSKELSTQQYEEPQAQPKEQPKEELKEVSKEEEHSAAPGPAETAAGDPAPGAMAVESVAADAAAGDTAGPPAADKEAPPPQPAVDEGQEAMAEEGAAPADNGAAAVVATEPSAAAAMEVEAGSCDAAAATAVAAEPSAPEADKAEGSEQQPGEPREQPEQPRPPQQPQQPQQQPPQRGGYGSFLPRPEVLISVLKSGFDSCLVAVPRIHPTAVLNVIWPLLAPSATFAVYCHSPQPLAEALTHLQQSRNAVLLQLQESWLRPYQVLPARTHPHMNCSGTGGYILSGIKVISPDATPLSQQLQLMLSQSQPSQSPEGPALPGAAAQKEGDGTASGAAADAGPARGGEGEGDKDSAAAAAKEGRQQSPGGNGGGGGGYGRGRGWGRDRDDSQNGGWRGRGGYGTGRGGGGGRGRFDDSRGGGGGRGRGRFDDNGYGGRGRGRGRFGDNGGGGRGRGRFEDNGGGGGRGWWGRGRDGGGRGKRKAEGGEGDSPKSKRQAQ